MAATIPLVIPFTIGSLGLPERTGQRGVLADPPTLAVTVASATATATTATATIGA